MATLNVSAYKFVRIEDIALLRPSLKKHAVDMELKGTILLAPEGINLFLAGQEDGLRQFLARLEQDQRFSGIECKFSWSEEQPFNRMLVKEKREIITMRRPDVVPSDKPAPRLAPEDLKQWLDEGREVLLLDTRNQFEVGLGTFRGAADLKITSFSQFPEATAALLEQWQDKPIVSFCTGGIRCEKAAPLLLQQGFRQVWQLDGGILKYFERCGGAHYEGECFVFDKRVALGPDLEPSGTAQCYACQAVLSTQEQASPDYVFGKHCPHCLNGVKNRGQREPMAA
jgi:UPF0176 protein